MQSGFFGLNGLGGLGLHRSVGTSGPFSIECLIQLGVSLDGTRNAYFSVSSNRGMVALNSDGDPIPLVDVTSKPGTSNLLGFDLNATRGNYLFNQYRNIFAVLDSRSGTVTMAVINEDYVSVVQRKITCAGISLELSTALDENPRNLSFSLDYVSHVGDETFATENIASCDHCHSGDLRYPRVYLVETYCVPRERAGRVQLIFKVDQEMTGGAGFQAFKHGIEFASYEGSNETVASMPGACEVN